MPHTSRRKQTLRNKRVETTDEDGWTRVATTNTTPRAPRDITPGTYTRTVGTTGVVVLREQQVSKPPEGTTLEDVTKKYRAIEREWLRSGTWKMLKDTVTTRMGQEGVTLITNCIVFGTGSFCGLVAGWISRCEVAMYQLAAFKALVDLLESTTGIRPPALAQEPLYNDLDVQLLSSLQIQTVADPDGFDHLQRSSLAYAPNAEFDVTQRVIAANPEIFLANERLENFWRNEKGQVCTNRVIRINENGVEVEQDSSTDRSICNVAIGRMSFEEAMTLEQNFKSDKEVSKIRTVDVGEAPFHDLHLFCRRPGPDTAE